MGIKGLQHKAIGLHIDGVPKEEIAIVLGKCLRTIQRWFADDDFLDELVLAYRKEYISDAGEAQETTRNIMRQGETHAVRLSASKDIQDRAGLKAPEKVDLQAEVDIYGTSDDATVRAAAGIIADLGRRKADTRGDDRPEDLEGG